MRDAFSQGARGYLTKGRDIDQFTDALRKVLDYGFYFPPEVTTPSPTPPASHLTDREEEVVRALASGKVNKQLADMLGEREHVQDTSAGDLSQARRQDARTSGRPRASLGCCRAQARMNDPIFRRMSRLTGTMTPEERVRVVVALDHDAGSRKRRWR